ncbi:MAG: hypothetical protein ACC645_19980 [Pirellulales bacterium]
MKVRRFLPTLVLISVGALGSMHRASAEPLWKKVIPAKRIEADAETEYVLSEDNGAWLIMAATFSGEGAEQQADELVLELRERYKLPAYTHEMRFDFRDAVAGRGIDRFGKPVRMRYRRNREIHEIAVLVGGYPRIDDLRAQRVLRKVKMLRPHTLDPKQRHKTNQSLAALRTIQAALLPDGDEDRKKGPMGKAFITRNPLLPREYFVSTGVDELVVRMNKGVPHSLLACKGKFTVRVATFSGMVVIDQKKLKAYQQGKQQMPSRLAQAAEKAHRLTMSLRQKGYDAYEFHDRHSSMVTVGSFGAIALPSSGGAARIDPRIQKIITTFSGTPIESKPGGPLSGFRPKTLAGVPFDLKPQVVPIPKPSIQAAFARR